MEYDLQVQLGMILDNPYQPRTTDNAEHIESLALSIAADGLLQVPTARMMDDGTYQLAFGHSFEWLNTQWEARGLANRYDGYWRMPINVEPMTDEEMYRYAVSENVQRRDLDPIELAKAMAVYRDQFGKSSKEIGVLFGMNDATVRGKMRLLDLPDVMKEKLSGGDISEGLGRQLLSMTKLASTQDLLEALQEAKENPDETPGYVVDRFVSNMDHVKHMWSSCALKSEKPKSVLYSREGWLLDMKKFPNHLLPTLDGESIIKALRVRREDRKEKDIDHAISLINGWANTGGAKIEGLNAVNVTALGEIDPEYVVKILHLLAPPACNVCPFYAVNNNDHYCGMKVCHDRKRAAWAMHRFEKMVKDLGIAVYQPADGKFRVLDTFTEKHLVAKKNKDLRIVPKYAWGGHAYQSFEGFDSDLGWLAITGETLKKRAEEKKQNKGVDRNGDNLAERITDTAFHTLKWSAATQVAAALFADFTPAAIERLFGTSYVRRTSFLEGKEPTEEHEKKLLWICNSMVDRNSDDEDELDTAVQMADALSKRCLAMGVKVSKSFMKEAAEFDAQIEAARVAVETEDE